MGRAQAGFEPDIETVSHHVGIVTLRKLTKAHAIRFFLPMLATILISISSALANTSRCALPCELQTDYANVDSALTFSRTHLSASPHGGVESAAVESKRWRHRYEIVITKQGDNRVVFDQYGNQHLFRLRDDGSYQPALMNTGELVLENDQYQWISHEGVVHDFEGSYLSRLSIPDERQATFRPLELRYNNHNRLSTVTDAQGNTLTFSYGESGMINVTTPEGDTVDYASTRCPAMPEHSGTALCETEANPLPAFPVAQNGIEGNAATTHYLDARPASCESFFTDFFGTQRGTQIERALESLPPYRSLTSTVRSFPIVDFIDGVNLIVVRSRDLSSPSFNDPDHPTALLDRLRRDGQAIQTRLLEPLGTQGQISHTEQGQNTTIINAPNQRVVLQLVIQHQIASPSHWRQIEQARNELRSRLGIELEVVLIP